MVRKWISGQEIMQQYGKQAFELGEVCYRGLLKAYVADSGKEIFDISLLKRIPKYPPIDIDPMQHVQQGEIVFWDWENILGIKKLYSKKIQQEDLLITLDNLNTPIHKRVITVGQPATEARISLPDDLLSSRLRSLPEDKIEQLKSKLSYLYQQTTAKLAEILHRKNWIAYAEVRAFLINSGKLYSINNISDSYTQRIGVAADFDGSMEYSNTDEGILFPTTPHTSEAAIGIIDKYTWRTMATSYLFLVGPDKIEKSELTDRLFYFDFEMFARDLRRLTLSEDLPTDVITKKYKTRLGSMVFLWSAVKTWLGLIEKQPNALSANVNDKTDDRDLAKHSGDAKETFDSTVLHKWREAVEIYDKEYKKRKNDALSARMAIFFRNLEGESSYELGQEYPNRNVHQAINQAKKKDIPTLMRIFPTLPHIN